MGNEFNFSEWCKHWLLTSGVNTLSPLPVYGPTGSLISLNIHQETPMIGTNRLRMQRLNIAIYDEYYKPHIIQNIVLRDNDPITPVDLNSTFWNYNYTAWNSNSPVSNQNPGWNSTHVYWPVSLIVINYGDHAYSKVDFDKKTLANLEDNMHRIEDPLTRAQIWRYLWYGVMDTKISSKQFLDILLKQIPRMRNELDIDGALHNVYPIFNSYLPIDMIQPYSHKLYNALSTLL
jgi:hypothetical protein